jgi:predicted DNA-binding transcriptional regulator AlpA
VDVAELLKLGKSTVWLYAKNGVLPRPVKIGTSARWKRSQIMQYIDSLQEVAA